MNKFITKSNESKQCYNLAKMATELKVNTLILGENGTGKKLLAREICEDCDVFSVSDFEEQIKTNKLPNNINLIIYDIDKANNLSYLLKVATKYNIRIIATATISNDILKDNFLIAIQISPLANRKEDIEYIKNIYFEDAKKIFKVDNASIDDIDFSQNKFSLKEMIYRYLALNSLDFAQLQDNIEHHFTKEFKLCEKEKVKEYKQYFSFLEIPLLKSAQKVFKSQLNISNKLKINRMTLRKKLSFYGLD